ncbi:hypothetical protein [uncultured Parasphingorhabdus sp.]|uniref:hypothetical protein n=1 Tax=uncultured Parasphingorhabdus sp. TaxID=2709694 RepID=UPI0030DDD679|tara:strand:+ start:12194 stop:12487 length:294 start_codon:yes stop_codon:yes gene_type:complete
MSGTNEDYIRRLKNDGHTKLLKEIDAGEITVYRAAIAAGYRKRKKTNSMAEHLTYHWRRSSEKEKIRFIAGNLFTLAPMVDQVVKERRALQAQKSQK